MKKKSNDQIYLLTSGMRHEVNRDNDLVEYVIMSDKVNEKTVKQDVKKGATRFKSLAEASNLDLSSRVSVIKCRTREDGLKACIYLLGIHNKMDGIDPDYYVDTYNYEDPDSSDAENVMPIIGVWNVWKNSDMYPFSNNVGWYNAEGVKDREKNTSYWEKHETGPIILWENNSSYGENRLSDVVSRMSKNRRVYLLLVDQPHSDWDPFSDQPVENDDVPVSQDVLKCILDHDAALYDVKEAKAMDETYYTKVFHGLLARYGMIVVDSSFEDKFISLLLEIVDDMRSELMDKIIKRESKRREDKVFGKEALALLGKVERADTESKGWETMESLAGMNDVKEKVKNFVDVRKYNRLRSSKGIKSTTSSAALLFVGPPGTAKTTVAKALGEIMFAEGLLPGKRFISVTGSGMQGKYLGSTSYRVRDEIFGNNDIIFIDEAYSLTEHSGKNMYADEALAELCVCLEDAQRNQDKLVIFAGYGGSDSKGEQNKMKQFLESNPGIKSRISDTIEFRGFSEEESISVFFTIASQNGYVFPENELPEIKSVLSAFFKARAKDKAFGNGRECRSLVGESVKMIASRLMSAPDKIDESQMRSMTLADIKRAITSMNGMEAARNGKQDKKVGFI